MYLKKNIVSIYYHSDPDGTVSAPSLKQALHERGIKSKAFMSVDFPCIESWRNGDVGTLEHYAVVDFPRPRQDVTQPLYWFDHHAGSVCNHEPVSDQMKDYAFNYRAKSCASLICKHMKIKDKRFWKLAALCDILDSADFVRNRIGLEQVMFPDKMKVSSQYDKELKAALIFSKALDRMRKERSQTGQWNSICEKLFKEPYFEKAVDMEVVRRNYGVEMAEQEQVLGSMENNTIFKDGVIMYDGRSAWIRFAPFCRHPMAKYLVTMRDIQHSMFEVGVAVNPWNRRNLNHGPNLGRMMQELFNGGGHKYIGAAQFSTFGDANEAIYEIIRRISEKKE